MQLSPAGLKLSDGNTLLKRKQGCITASTLISTGYQVVAVLGDGFMHGDIIVTLAKIHLIVADG